MHAYVVGQPYSKTRTRWPEVVEYNYRGGEHELRAFLEKPAAGEIAAIKAGACKFGVMVVDPVIFFLYDFGDGKIDGDAPFSMHLVPASERQAPPALAPGQQVLLHVILVDATTGIIKALRVVSMSPAMSAALHEAIKHQLDDPFEFDGKKFDETVARIHHDLDVKEMFNMPGS